ncbi:MAG: DUF1573 domain-containing protein [Candidatus Cyclobacteriaceae bacterium M3_2C_046]
MRNVNIKFLKGALSLIIMLMITGYSFGQNENTNGPVIKFSKDMHDFGDINSGEKVSYTFEFKNTGNQPLVLSNVLTTCGCTVTEWPKDPVAPGKSGQIEVKFNSTGRTGKQNKVITIISNATKPQERVKITANVLPKNS